MNRAFITPNDLRTHTSYDSVKARTDEQLSADIARAELYAISYCGQDFSGVEEGTLAAERLILAIKLLAEMYGFNAQLKATVANDSNGGHSVRSESSQDYSYSFSDSTEDMIALADLGIEELLDELRAGSWGDTVMRVTVL